MIRFTLWLTIFIIASSPSMYGADIHDIESKLEEKPFDALEEMATFKSLIILLHAGLNPNIKDAENDDILHYAVSKKMRYKETREEKYECIWLLLDKKGNPNGIDATGATPLFYLQHHEKDLLNLFMKHGANINARDMNGENLISSAMKEKNSHLKSNYMCRLKNSSPNFERENQDENAKHISNYLELLINLGVDFKNIDNKGNNILHRCLRLDAATMPSKTAAVLEMLNDLKRPPEIFFTLLILRKCKECVLSGVPKPVVLIIASLSVDNKILISRLLEQKNHKAKTVLSLSPGLVKSPRNEALKKTRKLFAPYLEQATHCLIF